MRILVIGEVFPFPPTDGRRYTIYYLLKRLSQEHEVRAFFFHPSLEEINEENLDRVKQFCDVQHLYGLRRLPAYLKIASPILPRPLSTYRYLVPRFSADIGRMVEKESFDLAHLFGVNVAQFWPLIQGLPRVIAPNDCISLVLQRLSGIRQLGMKRRLHALFQTSKMRSYEAVNYAKFHWCYVTTPEDADALLGLNPGLRVSVIPNGVEVPVPVSRDQRPAGGVSTLVISGSMESHRTVASILFFYRKVFPWICAKVPEVRLLIVGNNPPRQIQRLGEVDSRVDVRGSVPTMGPYLDQADVYVCPLVTATGLQTRMLEAMARGLPIVATPSACARLEAEHERELLIAEGAQEFAAAVVKLLGDRAYARMLGQRARERAIATYSWETVVERLHGVYATTIELARRERSQIR